MGVGYYPGLPRRGKEGALVPEYNASTRYCRRSLPRTGLGKFSII